MKNISIIVIAGFALCLGSGTSAYGQERTATGTKTSAKQRKASTRGQSKTNALKKGPPAKPVKEYDFSGDDIDGDRLLPNEDRILGATGATHTSLIRIRTHFFKEIIASANAL